MSITRIITTHGHDGPRIVTVHGGQAQASRRPSRLGRLVLRFIGWALGVEFPCLETRSRAEQRCSRGRGCACLAEGDRLDGADDGRPRIVGHFEASINLQPTHPEGSPTQ